MKIRVNKKQLETLLETLSEKLKDPRNSEIRESLRRMLDNADLRDLRDAMHLSGYKSIDYSFIKEDILRTQLEVDNMRMEDAAHSTQIADEERFFIFCINAFYQIENITNYYFVKRYPNFGDLMVYLEAHSNFKHKVNPKTQEIVEKGVGDVDISCKIFALCGELFPSTEDQPDFTYKMINNLRFVRNEGSHRCQVEGKPANEKLEKFYKYNDFNTVRETLRKYTTTIKEQLELPWNKPEDYQVWTFMDFAKEKGQPKLVSIQCEKGALPSAYLIFPSPNGNMENTRVDFGSELGILTAKEIVDKKDELFVVQFMNANIYYLHDREHINNYINHSNSI